jgi:hypothetical protein
VANIHALRYDGTSISGVAHVAIPPGNNSAGVSWQVALIRSGLGGTTVLPDGDGTGGTISAAEKSQIASGALYEAPITLRPESVAPAGIGAYVDSVFAQTTADVQAELQRRLKYFGYTR